MTWEMLYASDSFESLSFIRLETDYTNTLMICYVCKNLPLLKDKIKLLLIRLLFAHSQLASLIIQEFYT